MSALDSAAFFDQRVAQLGRLDRLAVLSLPVRWFAQPAFSCVPAGFMPPALSDHAIDYAWAEQSLPYRVPLFPCEGLTAMWACVGVAAALPLLLLLGRWAARTARPPQPRARHAPAPISAVPSSAAPISAAPSSNAPSASSPLSASSPAALEAAAEAGRLLRLKVSGALFAGGWALFVVGLTPLVVVLLRGKPDDAGLLVPLLPVGLIAMLLAVPPTADATAPFGSQAKSNLICLTTSICWAWMRNSIRWPA